MLDPKLQEPLQRGVAIPAQPLALDSNRQLDERRQRALTRYYMDAGAGGLAVGVHTTQFAIRDQSVGLFEPVLQLAAEEMDRADAKREEPVIRIAGVIGATKQAVNEATLARDHGYHAVLVSLAGLDDWDESALIEHCRTIGQVLPIFGFYLQPAVGGQVLPYSFWRRFAELEAAVAIKVAPFNRYRSLEVMRAMADAGRDDIALYTGNDDNIIADLLTPYEFQINGETRQRRFVGGLLGQWAVWTKKAVQLIERCHQAVQQGTVPAELLRDNAALTDANAAIFDAANGFTGVIPGVHEVLRRQGLLEGTWCLDPDEALGPGQTDEITRVYQQYPQLHDDAFVQQNLDRWLSG